MATFRTRIRSAIANEALQTALDGNAERRVNGRIAAFASLPNWQEKRQQAHAVRADVIEHLEEYLENLIKKVQQNGIIVHRAKDADEAVKTVLEIVKDLPQRAQRNTKESLVPLGDRRDERVLVAKSKSMVSEEIELNHKLEKEGIRVVETDLGEYIVQLRNEKPAHIITPAVHLRRSDVGKLFHEKLGIPYTEDIPTLTNTARKVLREVFLTADVGISGVNFAVAETGTLCLVTNEGNGRMVTTLPPIHIALMGMERLVRDLDDLALMLSLLPRAATGQKLSVYTQLIHSPFPGQQRHLVILDNGRSRIHNSPLKESLYCIRCGSCLNVCPVFREIGGHAYNTTYSGPIGSVLSAGFSGPDFIPLAQASSLCGACKDACPVDIDLPKLLSRVRAGQIPVVSGQSSVVSHGLSKIGKLFMLMFSRVARSPRLFAVSQRFAALGTRLASPSSSFVPLPTFTGWGYSKDLPRFAGKTFRDRWNGLDMEARKPADQYRNSQANIVDDTRQVVPSFEPVSRFSEELKKVSGNIVHTAPHELTNKIAEFLKSRGIEQIHLEPNVLDESVLRGAGIVVNYAPDASLRVGVTKAICGLADTGSILIADGIGNPLQASLLPEIHIAVLCQSEILPSLDHALKLPAIHQSKSAVVITGPSRTGDIEMSLTIGVHGPGELHVFLVHSTASTLVDD